MISTNAESRKDFWLINGRLSLDARLGLDRWAFVAASAIGAGGLIDRANGDIDLCVRRREGVDHLKDVWRSTVRGGSVDATTVENSFGAATVFQAAKTDADRVTAGRALIATVADGSNLTLGPERESLSMSPENGALLRSKKGPGGA